MFIMVVEKTSFSLYRSNGDLARYHTRWCTCFQNYKSRDSSINETRDARGWNELSVFQLSSPCFTVNEKWNVDETDEDTRYEEAISQLRSSNALPINTKLTERRVSVLRDTWPISS